jgi:phage shock protein A
VWYEEKLEDIQKSCRMLTDELECVRSDHDRETAQLTHSLRAMTRGKEEAEFERDELKLKVIPALVKDKSGLEKRLDRLLARVEALESGFAEEKAINASLRENQENWKKQVAEKDKLIAEQAEQVFSLF